jgi:hypothetical protein
MELKSLPTLTGRVLAFAVENDLTLADFEGTTPSGAGGNYTKADVEAIIANRAN